MEDEKLAEVDDNRRDVQDEEIRSNLTWDGFYPLERVRGKRADELL